MVAVSFSEAFSDRLRLLSEGRREHIINRLVWFQQRPDDPSLRLRDLRCAPGHYLIDSVRGDRIVLRRDADGVYVAVDCGGHEIIDEWERLAAQATPLPEETDTKH